MNSHLSCSQLNFKMSVIKFISSYLSGLPTTIDGCVFLPTQGYWGPRAFIAAQTPLPDTMADFWSMVYQKRVSTIIMLSDCNSEDEVPSVLCICEVLYLNHIIHTSLVYTFMFLHSQDCGYWGKDKKTFEDLEVDLVSTDKSPTFIIRSMLIRHVKVTQ